MRSRHYDDWTIESWRVDGDRDPTPADIPESQNPPLWKDVALACLIAAALWLAVAMLFM